MVDAFFVGAIAATTILALWYTFQAYLTRSPLDNLPGPPAPSFLLGNVPEITNRDSWKWWKDLVETYGPVSKLQGMFGARVLHVSDPKAMYSVLIKDVELYPKNDAPSDDMHVLLGPGLLTTEGAQNRKQRKLMNPVFSVAHLRNMTHIFYGIAHKLQRAMDARVGKNGGVLDVNGWMGRTTLEMLGQAGLGYSFDNFEEDSTDSYGESLKMFFPVLSSIVLVTLNIPALSYILPDWLIKRIMKTFPQAEVRRMAAISDTMERRSMEIISEKKHALLKGNDALIHQIGEGKDIMSLLLKANMVASDGEKHTDEELVAQMSTFILAGMDTTSNALSRILHVLAQNPTAQDKLRAEITEACGGEDLPYDDLVKLPYLEAVCRETLRLHAPVQFVKRLAAKDTMLPLLKPIRSLDGSVLSEVPVPKGTIMLLHFTGCNTSRDLWGDDAEEWKPERWLGKLPQAVDDARIPGVYSSLMTFSGGGRACIGFKFSQLEMKVVLAVLLSAFKFETTEEPITWNSSGVLYPATGDDRAKPQMLLKMTRVA
uniref:Cytochrome P450 monooxygenase n=1 Tax=Trametes versicolor TaxID=5325 RepID=A0AA86J4F0_TRAVE|nr:cytochrome P450 monooxygenase [Trametes versicolor]